MMTARNSLSRVMLPVVALASGIIVALILVATRPEAQKVEQQEQGVLVQSIRVQRGDAEVTLRARGTVTAAQEVVLHPEVGGRVTWLHDRLVPGGRIAKGKVLVRIDARDYQLALQAGQAQLEQARVELELERGRQVIAQREWEAFGGADAGVDDPSRQRALRQPQMQAAEVSLQAAQSNLQQRALSLQRTRITAPFNALVLSERVDKGQLVTPQNEIARLVGTDAYWVRVSIPVGALSAIDVPGLRGVDEGSAAQIVQQLGNEHVRRQGRVRRLLADLDPGGTMARITVEVRDPLGLQDEGEPKLPLLLSSYVEVILEARPLKNVVTLPRTALREGDWLAGVGPGGDA
ncbi:MAG: efflux RND transporter periplasmic adaptor subunit, partial [Polyangiales bacterium]